VGKGPLLSRSSSPSSYGGVGPGTTDQAAGAHGLVPDAAPSVPAVLNTTTVRTGFGSATESSPVFAAAATVGSSSPAVPGSENENI